MPSKTGKDNTNKNFRKTQRKPMLLFVFPGVLFKFSVKSPAFDPLFQLPPRRKERESPNPIPPVFLGVNFIIP
jgi:hypothetical protein